MTRTTPRRFQVGLLLGLALALVPAANRAAPPATAPVTAAASGRPAGATGTVVVPDRFLRSWDPVTIFFDRDLGPPAGGPEDQPERFARLSPAHPGAFAWLNARTLQFRPAEPWPPFGRFTWTVDGRAVSLATLLQPPSSSVPANGARDLQPVETITLEFREPIAAAALRAMVAIELRSLPGLEGSSARFLTGRDFAVRELDRADRQSPATYVLDLQSPIPAGTRAIVHFQLAAATAVADGAGTGGTTFDLGFSTAEPFRIVRAGCRGELAAIAAAGTRMGREQPLRCAGEDLLVEFSAPPAAIGPVEARNLVRLEPSVVNFEAALEGSALAIRGDFARDTLYRMTLAPPPLRDQSGRLLERPAAGGESVLYLFFPPSSPFLRWAASQGILERHGPQMAPLEGRGNERVDLRIFPIAPLDRSFWPFPEQPVRVDETERPPGPGEEPAPWSDPDAGPGRAEIGARIRALGSPPVSTLETLPLRRAGGAATFGLDLAPHLARIAGRGAPGTYLVGLRTLDKSSERAWVRLQVTDLALSTLEEPAAVVFAVTSLQSAAPIPGAEILVEGRIQEPGKASLWQELYRGTTDLSGRLRWQAPGPIPGREIAVRRIVVRKGEDVLVLDPARAPDRYRDGEWAASSRTWLDWVHEPLGGRAQPVETTAHVFTDRPVYRPEETVHIKGFVRRRERGAFAIPAGSAASGTLLVTGPGDLVWRFPTTLSAAGSFYQAFAEEKLPTGVYSAAFQDRRGEQLGAVSFRMEAYRLPRFEVQLQAPERTPLDREFTVALTATYYAGGRVAARPIQWRVTQFPHTWAPRARPGFLYSSDGRFSRTATFESSPRLEKQDSTDEQGAAKLVLNPAIEPTADPRGYVIEATVTGEDDQTVTATRMVVALPPFVLGVKLPRYLAAATEIAPEVVVVGADGEALAGQPVTVRLLHRQWHSVLRASDFTDGVARYLTDVVDEKIAERTITSGKEPLRLLFPITQAGVYVVEVEAADRLGRSQRVAADLYAGGDGAVAWARPQEGTFTITPAKPRYAPGETATLVLQSPFQRATALAVIEAPTGNDYQWISIEGGSGTLEVPIAGTSAPRLPVHVVLQRGRLAEGGAQAGDRPRAARDLGKPTTVASTVWLDIEPVENRVAVTLQHPEKARPGQTIDIQVRLQDERQQPLAGEVTLWLVDQAVLALGREQRLDPLPAFVRPAPSLLEVRDSRNLAFGFLPFAENPGGDEGERDAANLLDRATVRRSFQPVPYFNPSLQIGPEGVATVTVQLPDNLTNFKLRAKAVAGAGRFGFATGHLAVRLPVIFQPALPRFVRPGDSFLGAAIGRVVEGEGGPAAAQIAIEGGTLGGPATRALELTTNRPSRVEFPVEIPTPPLRADGSLARTEVVFRAAVERTADRAGDAFEIKLPIAEDRRRTTVRVLRELRLGESLELPAPTEPARPGSVRRSLVASEQAALVRMAAALDHLREYPYGCTEQRVSSARAELAVQQFRGALRFPGDADSAARTARAVADTLSWLPTVVDRDGLCAFWPGGEGSVWLTAWAAQFLAEAKTAGHPVDPQLLATLTRALEQALRSDYARFLDGESYAERSAALLALATLGKAEPAYAAELARATQWLDLESTAQVLRALEAVGGGDATAATTQLLRDELWRGLTFRLHQGREIYAGLEGETSARNALVLPSETRTLAEVTRALAGRAAAEPRFPLLVTGLVELGGGDGWGDTNTNAAALLALADVLRPPLAAAAPHTLQLRFADGAPLDLEISTANPLASFAGNQAETQRAVLTHAAGAGAIAVRAETSFLPAADGSQEANAAHGFVVTREQQRQRGEDQPAERLPIAAAGTRVALAVGDVVEEHVQIVNPQDRHFVAIVVPLAAGVEPLNPALATAPPDAKPRGQLTLPPTYVAFLDDQLTYFYDTLPKGTYDFYFRVRATTSGSFVQPAARAELMYDQAVYGNSPGARVAVAPAAGQPAGPQQ